MNKTKLDHEQLKISGEKVLYRSLFNNVRKLGLTRKIIGEYILEEALKEIVLTKEEREKAIKDYKERNGIKNEEYKMHITNLYLNEELALENITKINRIIKFREEKWGGLVKSLYLNNKNDYNKIKYYQLESFDPSLTQNIYYSIKDDKMQWTEVVRKYLRKDDINECIVGPIKEKDVEPEIRKTLIGKQTGKVNKPVVIRGRNIITELIDIQKAQLDRDTRDELLANEFNKWINNRIDTALKTIKFES